MSKEEFLRGLEEALTGEVPASVIRENVNYYDSYISQETAKGRTVEEIAEEIGEPRIIARTIIDSSEAAGETGDAGAGAGNGGYGSASGGAQRDAGRGPEFHNINTGKWYWKILAIIVVFFVVTTVFGLVGGLISFLIRFSGPIIILALVFWFIKSMRRK